MRKRFSVLLVALASFAGCGASCKKNSDAPTADESIPIELPGVDTSSLILAEKRIFSKVVREYMSPCGDPVTLEVCVREARACKKCLPAAQAAAMLVPRGEGDKEVRDWLDNRFDDKSVKSIDLTGSPSLGPSSAPLVVVEFADFQCPFCGVRAPMIHAILEEPEFKGKIRFVFKNFPLPMHEHGEAAARAAIAAQNQGKFWEMHDQMFTHQDKLSDNDLEAFARKLSLDIDRWKLDFVSPETKTKLTNDKKLGEKNGVTGTPTLFINGRHFPETRADFADGLKSWLRVDLAMTGHQPKVAPSAVGDPEKPGTPSVPSVIAAPSASASSTGASSRGT